jgi:hypothetical protein
MPGRRFGNYRRGTDHPRAKARAMKVPNWQHATLEPTDPQPVMIDPYGDTIAKLNEAMRREVAKAFRVKRLRAATLDEGLELGSPIHIYCAIDGKRSVYKGELQAVLASGRVRVIVEVYGRRFFVIAHPLDVASSAALLHQRVSK